MAVSEIVAGMIARKIHESIEAGGEPAAMSDVWGLGVDVWGDVHDQLVKGGGLLSEAAAEMVLPPTTSVVGMVVDILRGKEEYKKKNPPR